MGAPACYGRSRAKARNTAHTVRGLQHDAASSVSTGDSVADASGILRRLSSRRPLGPYLRTLALWAFSSNKVGSRPNSRRKVPKANPLCTPVGGKVAAPPVQRRPRARALGSRPEGRRCPSWPKPSIPPDGRPAPPYCARPRRRLNISQRRFDDQLAGASTSAAKANGFRAFPRDCESSAGPREVGR